MPVDPSSLDKALTAIKRTYGDDSIVKGNEKPVLRRIPTGSLELDYATGGGVPLGRWMHFYGPKSSSKTLTAWNIIAQAQAMGLKCAYYNIEKQYDEVWCQKHGIDTENLELVQGAKIEEVGAKLETLLGSVHLHVIDSLAAAVSQEELLMKADEWRPGIGARSWGKVLRRANERFDDQENAVIMINQTRSTFGYGGADQPTMGAAIGYIARLELAFRRSSWLFYDKNGVLSPDAPQGDSLTGDKEPDGIEFQVRVEKTAGFGRPQGTARMRLDYGTGQYDEMWTLVKGAKFYKLVDQAGSWYTCPGGKKVQGEAGLREYISANPKFADKIIKALLERGLEG